MKTVVRAKDDAVALVAELRACGLTIEPDPPGHVIVRPSNLLNEELVARVRALKPALLELLAGPPRSWPCTRCGNFAFRLPTICYWCRRAEGSEHHA